LILLCNISGKGGFFGAKLSFDMKKLLLPCLGIALFGLLSCTKQSLFDMMPLNVAAPNPALSASFSINNPNSTVNEKSPVFLTNHSTNAVSCYWEFGNGNTSTEAVPNLSYQKCGIYTIKLTVTGSDGSTKTAQHEITSLCIFGGVHGSN